MKTIIILLCSALFIPALFSQTLHHRNSKVSAEFPDGSQNLNQLEFRSDDDVLDSLQVWKWDSSFQWQLFQRSFYTSDADNNIISELFLVWDGAQWINGGLYTYSYDENNNSLGYLFQFWNGTGWENSEQTLYTYDANNNQTSIVDQEWNGADWVNNLGRFSTYDTYNNLTELLYGHWNGANWDYSNKHIFTYDENNKLILRLVLSWNGQWVNNQQIMYSYDVNDDLETDLNQRWITDHWEDNSRNFYIYDANHNRIQYRRQVHVGGGVWEDDQRFFFTYDMNNDILTQLYQDYINGEWVNVYQFLVTNDEKQNRITEVFQVWDEGWINQDSFHYFYTLSTGTWNYSPDPIDISLYPNPATSSLGIILAESSTADISIEIFSNNGVSELKTLINPLSKKTLDISRLAPGEYHVLIRTTKGIAIQNFVKL